MLYNADQKFEKAIAIYSQLLDKDSKFWQALRGRGDAWLGLGKHAEAIADYEKAYKIRPNDSGLLNNFSWVLSTSPFDKLRNGKRALEMAKKACQLTDYKQAHILSTLAAAYAELGDFKTAIEWSQKAVAAGKEDQKEALARELATYKEGKPVRELKAPEPPPKAPPKKPGGPKPKPPEKPKPAEKPKPEPPPKAPK
jgi:tetratricopeptide (TPR) repeat protein